MEILLYGVIGSVEDKLDSATVTSAIRGSTGPLSVRINSPGGFIMEGLAIIEALRSYPAKVTIYIDGLAASMASVIAMVGTEIIMAEPAMMMIHRAWDSAFGNADELRRTATQLDKLEAQIIKIYATRTGLSEAVLSAMMAEETWLTSDEALAKGFVTSISTPLKLAAMAKATGYGFRHVPDHLKQKEGALPEQNDTASAVTLERTRISTIMELGDKHKLPGDMTRELIAKGTALGEARAAMLDYLAAESDRQGIGHRFAGDHVTLDNPATRAKAMADAVTAKMLGRPAEGPAAEYRGMTLVEIARECLAGGGVRDAYRMSADRVAAMVMQPGGRGGYATPRAAITQTTSDFPDIMQVGLNTTLAVQYKTLQSPLKALTQIREVANFKSQTIVRVSSFGSLDRVGEVGEYKYKSINTSANSFKIDTYGNLINFSRQMLINDQLGALADITTDFARAVANNEADMIAGVINANPVLADQNPWFSAEHGNIASGAGNIAPPTITTVDAGRQAMRSQKDLDKQTFIDAAPKFLLVPLSLQTGAETLVAAAVAPGTQADVNPFFQKLEPISDPRMVGKAWYLFADPNFAPAFILAYLNGQAEPFIDQQLGWETDGIEYKVRHDVGVGVVDAKTAYKNPG